MRQRVRQDQARAHRSAVIAGVAIGLVGVALATGILLTNADAQAPSSGSGAQRFDDLRELNNKLGRAIAAWENHELFVGRDKFDRTIKDLEVAKLRAVDQFPPVFGLPYRKTFVQLSCVNNELGEAMLLSRLKKDGLFSLYLTGSGLRRTILVILQYARAWQRHPGSEAIDSLRAHWDIGWSS